MLVVNAPGYLAQVAAQVVPQLAEVLLAISRGRLQLLAVLLEQLDAVTLQYLQAFL